MGKKNAILLVDDSPIDIAALSQILQDEYTLLTAKDGLSCLEIARMANPDLILLDVLMPGMSGFEVIQELKKNPVTAETPVIFITGLNKPQDEEKGFLLGAVDYISKPFTPAVVRLRVRNQIQIINQIRHIFHLSTTDELTGIGNRRYFYEQLEQEWQRALRDERPISFIIMDIDKFKHYNDQYGHMQGDYVLKVVADTVKNSLTRATDKCARWGGEEFVAILPGTDLNGAREVAERIRIGIEKLVLQLSTGKTTSVTISLGIHCVVPSRGEETSLNKLISDADAALYYSKSVGGNRVCAFEDMLVNVFAEGER